MLRLVRPGEDADSPQRPVTPGGLEITVLIRGLPRMPLTQCISVDPNRAMEAAPAPVVGRMPSVAGKIDAHPNELLLSVKGWEANLRARKKNSAAGMARTARRIIRLGGWSTHGELTHAAIVGLFDEQVESGDWRGATYNTGLTIMRSFTRWCKKNGKLGVDPLAEAERAEDDSSEDCRAATTEEARAIVRYAFIREQADGRAGCYRDRVYAALFLHGCRPGEPTDKWRWKHLNLDAPVPFIHWGKEINKNGKDQDVAIAPELVDLLKMHRESMFLLAKTGSVQRRRRRVMKVDVRKIDPDDPEAFVFPYVTPRTTWRNDRRRAGVAEQDRRGLGVTMRSARKWFKTTLIRAGVHGDIVRKLMRHAQHADEGYFDATLEDQAAALLHLPRLWPEVAPSDVGKKRMDLTTPKADGIIEPLGSTHQHNPSRPPPPVQCAVLPSYACECGGGRDGLVISGVPGLAICGPNLDGFSIRPFSDPTMPKGGSINGLDRIWLGRVLIEIGRGLL